MGSTLGFVEGVRDSYDIVLYYIFFSYFFLFSHDSLYLVFTGKSYKTEMAA